MPILLSITSRIGYAIRGEFGFSEQDKSIAHMVVEREIDEMMLYVNTGKTVSDFDPAATMLSADDELLNKISAAFSVIVFRSMG